MLQTAPSNSPKGEEINASVSGCFVKTLPLGGVGGGLTWYFLGINSCQQMLYSLKRINEPLREHVGNSFSPMPEAYHERFIGTRESVLKLYNEALQMLETGDFTNAEAVREACTSVQQQISKDRKRALDSMQDGTANLNTLLLTIHILQESQELVSSLRHMIRGMNKFAGAED